jgi:hypothetical protein
MGSGIHISVGGANSLGGRRPRYQRGDRILQGRRESQEDPLSRKPDISEELRHRDDQE